MTNGQIKGDGTSRLLKSYLPNTYDEFKALMESGQLPVDVLFNPSGWSTLPTFLNKETLLKNVTAALYGLDEAAVPDDVLSIIKTLLDTAQSTANGRARVSTGTYVGTGTTGSSNKKSLIFDFPVQFFILHDGSNTMYTQYSGSNGSNGINQQSYLLVPRLTAETDIIMFGGGSPYYQIYNKFLFSGNTVSWYAYSSREASYPADASKQFNASGKTYYYIAIG